MRKKLLEIVTFVWVGFCKQHEDFFDCGDDYLLTLFSVILVCSSHELPGGKTQGLLKNVKPVKISNENQWF